jgi:lipid-binding SYLF domain-containing protein
MTRFNLRTAIGAMAAAVALAFAAHAYAKTDSQLLNESRQTVQTFQSKDPGLSTFFSKAPGYVVFPAVGKGGFGIGGAFGEGVVYQNNQPIGRAKLTQISVGAQIGGQKYAEVIFFETTADLAHFVQGNFAFSGSVSAVALKSGASANAKYRDGVAVFTAAEGGLMLEAAVGGQKFGYEPFVTIEKK